MDVDLWELYQPMLRSRLFEEVVKLLWQEGLISGEMHTSIGEEGIAVGVVCHLRPGDALALDHRGTAPLIVRGVDPVLILRELLGYPDGLCAGRGGHMHLCSQEHLAVASGIVGASGPAAAGFALAGQMLRPESVAVAFFGEGALNQGMLMEAMNLAVAWNLPLIFICKDNDWSITTQSTAVTAADVEQRALGFGLPVTSVDGTDVTAVYAAAQPLIDQARAGGGPSFLHARCVRPDGHMLGDLMLRTARLQSIPEVGPFLGSAVGRGSSFKARLQTVRSVVAMLRQVSFDHAFHQNDPLQVARQKLSYDLGRLQNLEADATVEMASIVEQSLTNNQERRELP
jgi:pyruvate dehydrogenase E1 component alpha subunit